MTTRVVVGSQVSAFCDHWLLSQGENFGGESKVWPETKAALSNWKGGSPHIGGSALVECESFTSNVL